MLPKTASEVENYLIKEGCNPTSFSIGTSRHDAFCLNKKGGNWMVYYSERGIDYAPIHTNESESEACKFFCDYVLKQPQWHLVGFFIEQHHAHQFQNRLKTVGIPCFRNDIPAYRSANDPRYRVFVKGKDIFKFRDSFGNPVVDLQ